MSPSSWIAMCVGGVFIVMALIGYNIIYWCARAELRGLLFREVIAELASHLPDDDSPAWPHIVSGVAMTVGVSLLLGYGLEGVALLFDERAPVGLGASLAGVVFSAEIGAISFWTLWQTKRIERGQGVLVTGFQDLTSSMSRAMLSLYDELEQTEWNPSPHHRFLLVTTNPWFGMLSHPQAASTQSFREGLLRMAQAVKNCQDCVRPFEFGILMGDNQRLDAFHDLYFEGLSSAKKARAVQEATSQVETLVQMLIDTGAPRERILAKSSVPAFQFAVIGNTVFEFILETVDGATEVQRARVLRERVLCQRFVQTFEVLRGLP